MILVTESERWGLKNMSQSQFLCFFRPWPVNSSLMLHFSLFSSQFLCHKRCETMKYSCQPCHKQATARSITWNDTKAHTDSDTNTTVVTVVALKAVSVCLHARMYTHTHTHTPVHTHTHTQANTYMDICHSGSYASNTEPLTMTPTAVVIPLGIESQVQEEFSTCAIIITDCHFWTSLCVLGVCQ